MFDRKAWQKEYDQKHREGIRAYRLDYNQRHLSRLGVREMRRLEQVRVLMHYSNPTGTPICNNCGEQDMTVLCIDHISGGGSKHEKERNSPLSRWLIKNNYPSGFQVLCANCNIRKSKLEYCENGN